MEARRGKIVAIEVGSRPGSEWFLVALLSRVSEVITNVSTAMTSAGVVVVVVVVVFVVVVVVVFSVLLLLLFVSFVEARLRVTNHAIDRNTVVQKSRNVSTGPFTRSLAPLTHLLAPHNWLCSRALLRSFVRSLTHSLVRGTVID